MTPGGAGRRGQVEAHGIGFDFAGIPALDNADLTVQAGEFFTLLGPSGSGKTTLLRIIAGLLEPQRGRIEIDGDDVTRMPTQKRDIGFVFQNYALFPFLTVAENIEFGLKLRRVAPTLRAKRVAEMIELVALGGLGDRYPAQLSGGQQQRVALGRALAQRPRVLLLDEPLGALDRRLRQELGAEIRRIQQEAETTAIYVTHDQEEAFILSDRVGVMYGGLIHQIGTPADLYQQPTDLFVAQFVGETNLFDGVVVAHTAIATLVRVGDSTVAAQLAPSLNQGDAVYCSIRPEQLLLHRGSTVPPGDRALQHLGEAQTKDIRFLGQRSRVRLTATGGTFIAELDPAEAMPIVGAPVAMYARAGCAVLVKRDRTDSPIARPHD
jgi:ABC-type Fe3+/spermidine/putrescine transport system ATPase subunit